MCIRDRGAAFKEQYLENAIRAGAVAYVSEVQYETETKVPCLIVKDIRKAMPPLAEMYFNKAWQDVYKRQRIISDM